MSKNGITKTPRQPRGFDVSKDGRPIGWYEEMLPSDGKGYRWNSPNGGHGEVRRAKQAVASLLDLDSYGPDISDSFPVP